MAGAMGSGSKQSSRSVIRAPTVKPRSPPIADEPCQFPGETTLDSLIHAEIIPRLLMAHADLGYREVRCGPSSVEPEEPLRFADLSLELEADGLMAVVEGFLDRGVSVESILIDLLAPAARRLGVMWEEDACDFVDVTMGLWRMQEIMREVTLRSPAASHEQNASRVALFSAMPGEQHSFGSLMLEEVFARAGWETDVLIEPKRKNLLEIVATRPFHLVGLTLSCDSPSSAVSELVTSIRSVSKSPSTKIFIGGRMVNTNPEIVSVVGADGTASDARSALALAERMITGSTLLGLPVP